ncbi:MAG: Na+/H+ antiporter subunit D [Bacteroidetes bacterium]|nr:Na+/H+ antiporter subunit D [Bacteroidota bacterium]HET6244489.1 Na+/H+ antiporter subunit D [Bacteroidia bacterium]
MNSYISIILPIVVPCIVAILSIFFWWKQKIQLWLNIFGALIFLGTTVNLFLQVNHFDIITFQSGNWPAPFGITLVADLYSAIMILVTGILGSGGAIYSMVSMDKQRIKYGFFPLFYFLMMGISGAFLAGDLFNLYVWFELILITSFVLIALGSEKAQLEGAIKYVTLNLFASIMLLTAVGMIYGITGALNMADIAVKVAAFEDKGIINIAAVLFIIAFGIKAAVFPLFYWLPASYHTPPIAVSAIFAGLLTKVGTYALIRIFTLIFIHDIDFTHFILLVIAGFTMVTGVLGAVAQSEIRRLLSFHIISQIGYMIMGLAIFTPLALAGAIYFMFHNIIVKNALFLVSGIIYKIKGHYQLYYLGGLYQAFPFLSILFLIPALSLAGVPPLSGFWGKFILMKAAIETEQYAILAISLIVSVLTLFSMIKIWTQAFWKTTPKESLNTIGNYQQFNFMKKAMIFGPIIWLCILIGLISFGAETAISIAQRAAEQLMDPQIYINEVLGK